MGIVLCLASCGGLLLFVCWVVIMLLLLLLVIGVAARVFVWVAILGFDHIMLLLLFVRKDLFLMIRKMIPRVRIIIC